MWIQKQQQNMKGGCRFMGLLSTRTSGKQTDKPPLVLIHGEHGTGKTGFIASMKDAGLAPILADVEDGSRNYDMDRVNLSKSTYPEILEFIRELRDADHDFNAFGLDSLDFVESRIIDHVLEQDGSSSILKALGGYGAGFRKVRDHFSDLLDGIIQLRDRRGMVVVLTAHSEIKRVEHPEHPAFDRIVPRLNQKSQDLYCETVDAVIHAHRRFSVREASDGRAQAVGIKGPNAFCFRAVGGPSCIAKNRLGIPDGDHDLSWSKFVSVCS